MKKLILAVIFIIGIYFNSFGDESDGHWVSMGELPLLDKSAEHLAIYGDYLYIASDFDAVRSVLTKNIARLHIPTEKWESLNYENGSINAIATGSNGSFYTVGKFCTIYKFENDEWENLSLSGKCDGIYSIVVDKNNTVFVGGSFDIGIDGGYGLVKWENDEWQETGFYHSTSVLTKDYSGNIYAGSRTYGKNPDDFYYFSIGKYNGNSWKTFETFTDFHNDEELKVLAVDEKGAFYIFNRYLSIGTLSSLCILKSDGTSWSEFDGCISCDSPGVDSCNILKMKFDKYGNLFIAGNFLKVENTVVNNIAFWNGTKWSDLNGGTNGVVTDFAFDDDGNLYAIGLFSQAGGIDAKYLAKYVVGEISDEDSDIVGENDINDNDSESIIPDTETAKKDNSGCTLLFL